MNLSRERQIKHLAWVIAGGFIGSVALFIFGLFFPPELIDGNMKIPPFSIFLGLLQTTLFILGCVAFGVKLAEEKKTLPAIGYTMLSIAYGVMFVIYLTITGSKETLDEAFRLFSGCMFLIIPSMILIAFYSSFPRWLNIIGVVSVVPYVIENILFVVYNKATEAGMLSDVIGQFLVNITSLSWGIIILKNAKREIAGLSTER